VGLFVVDIKTFVFDPVISGQVLKGMLKSRGISIASAEISTGILYDTLRKCLSGDVQRVSLDTIVKVCKICGYTIYDYFTQYFSTVQSDAFADVVSAPSDNSAASADKSAVSPCQGIEYVKTHIDALQAQHTAKIAQQYETIIAELHEQVAQLKEGRQMMHNHYQRTTDHLYDEIKKLEAENAELSAIITKRHRHTGEK
jgi:hypothetical protein